MSSCSRPTFSITEGPDASRVVLTSPRRRWIDKGHDPAEHGETACTASGNPSVMEKVRPRTR